MSPRSAAARTGGLPTRLDFTLGFEPVAQIVAMLTTGRFPKFIGATVHFLIVIHLIFLCWNSLGS